MPAADSICLMKKEGDAGEDAVKRCFYDSLFELIFFMRCFLSLSLSVRACHAIARMFFSS